MQEPLASSRIDGSMTRENCFDDVDTTKIIVRGLPGACCLVGTISEASEEAARDEISK